MKSTSTLTDVTKLYGLAIAASQSMSLSSGLANVDTMVSIGRAVAGIPLSQFVLVQFPTTLYGDGLVPNESASKALLTAVKADKALRLAKKQKGATDGQGSVARDDATSSPSPSTSGSPTPSASSSASSDVADLPDTVVGQPVDQETCSVGNDLGRR
jgi:hypothetical protein